MSVGDDSTGSQTDPTEAESATQGAGPAGSEGSTPAEPVAEAPPETADVSAADEDGPISEDPEPDADLADPLHELQSRYDAAQARLRTVSKAYKDLQGEMAAFRERMEARSKMESERQAFDQARRFFDPVMNLKRSLQQPTDDVEALRNGLLMVQKQFMEAMERLGLEEVPGEGASFDPNVHEALAVTPVTDPQQDGKVLMVHTVGFTVKGKVLQAAQVVIGKHQADAGEA